MPSYVAWHDTDTKTMTVGTRTVTTTRSVSSVTVVDWTSLDQTRREPGGLRIRSCATSTLPTWLSWSPATSCSSWGTSRPRAWGVPWRGERAPQLSYFLFLLRSDQVDISKTLYVNISLGLFWRVLWVLPPQPDPQPRVLDRVQPRGLLRLQHPHWQGPRGGGGGGGILRVHGGGGRR